jgi:outer membrane receptor protein involved in Fe transport
MFDKFPCRIILALVRHDTGNGIVVEINFPFRSSRLTRDEASAAAALALQQGQGRGEVMIRINKSALIGFIVAGTPFIWQQSAALDSTPRSDSDAYTLETIVVTAEKREERLQDVPMSVTALSEADLDRLQDRSFADYAALVPGLSLQTAQQGMTRLTLRGQNAGGDGSTVAVYIDESPFGSSNALANGGINTGDFDTWDMQRIEVLRGPQGTLYGSNSEGGLLKFVTNAPVLGSLAGAAEVTGESVDHGGTGGAVHATVNLPLGNIAAFRISGFDQDVPGYVSDPLTGERNVNDGHKDGGRASLLVFPTDALSIRLTADSQQAKYNGTNLVDVNPVTLQPLYGNLTQERSLQEPSSFKYENYNATINWSPGPLSVLSSTSYSILNTDTDLDATPLYGGLAGELFGVPTAGALLDDNVSLDKFTQEIRLTSAATNPLEWQVGGYYTREASVLNENLNAVTLPSASLLGLIEQPLLDSVYKETAGFGDLTYHFNSQFDVQVGGRYSHNEQTFEQTTTFNPLISPTPQSVTGSSNGNVFTYSVAPSWHVDANTMVYMRVATGYRPGGPNDLPPTAPPTVQREYAADKTTNVELGIRSTQLNGMVSVDVAAYHVDWKDIQLLELVDTFNINANGGTARTQGLEWTFGYVPVRGLKFQWIGAFTEANLTSPAPALNASSGDPLPYVPKWTTALDGQYEWAAFAGFKSFVGATWSYVGSRSSDFSSSPPATDPGQLVLPSYNTTAVRLGLDNDRYRVMLYGKNLSDARGITDYASTSGGSPYNTISVIQPRTIGVTLSAKF